MSTDTLDCSDIDQYLGKPITSSSLREPIGNNDIRRWVHAMHYANLLHFDPRIEQTRGIDGISGLQLRRIALLGEQEDVAHHLNMRM